MDHPTFTQSNATGLPPKPPNPVIIDSSHQLLSIHHTPASLTPPKWNPIDLQNSSTVAILIETIRTLANSGHQQSNEPIGMHPKTNLASIGGSYIGGTPILLLALSGDSILTSGGWSIASNLVAAIYMCLMDLYLCPHDVPNGQAC
ncbi:hypothetical protein Adt_04226 [Abeliophyllum distichum]|uniref:Uncharacterized protein n=1 Tax=Abeliophyllum distichum TaxID=126358 RepID=A0ABD1W2U0_9LAMI